MTNTQDAEMNAAPIPLHCPHCHRDIPLDQVASFDLSGCLLLPPCPRGGLSMDAAWPREDDDDEGDERVSPEPSLSGGAA